MFFSLLFFSCSEKQVTIPENVINQKEMASILTEIHLSQAAFGDQSLNDSLKFSQNDYITFILKQHKVEKDSFLNSLKFYSNHPEILESVYDSVITTLSKLQGENEN